MDVDPWLVRFNAVPALGPLVRTRLLERFGSPRAVLEAPTRALAGVAGVSPRLAESLRDADGRFDAEREIDRCADAGISFVTRGAPGYPASLDYLPYPPPLLYVRGTLDEEDVLSIAVVGARRCSSYGRRQARRIATGLAAGGITVVSGMARGIDSTAHRAALEAGGRTIAVLGSGLDRREPPAHAGLGSGLDRLYPPEHAGLAAAIADAGAVVSEFPLDASPRRHHFPRRNRVIAGLAYGVVVIEAAERSGSLITATLANDGGRTVFAVPGPVDSELSRGTHRLLRDGAMLVDGPDEILEELGLGPSESRNAAPDDAITDPLTRRVLEAVPLDRAILVDEIVQALELPAGAVLAALGTLTIEGIVGPEDGGRYARA